MTARTQVSYCRICEAHCGIEVTVDDDERVLSVTPDKRHPVSKGYACIKGAGLAALHHDPDRVNYPMKRVNGRLQRISWPQAMAEIGAKVKQLRQKHKRSIALYTGNPTYFNFKNILYSQDFMKALGSPNLYSSHSVDANNKLFVATQMYGLSMVHPVPDLTHTEFAMFLGTNPVVSQMSFIQLPNALERFKAIEARGGSVVFIDPRRTETAAKVGEHHFIKPNTDVYLLLAMLHVIAHEDGIQTAWLEPYAEGVDAFIAAAKPWSPERAASLTGIEADTIRALARRFRQANGASLFMSTGVNMGPFGSLAYWLVQGLNLITGNIDRRGGLLVPPGPFDALKVAQALGVGGEDGEATRVNGWRKVAGCFPVSALPEEITQPEEDRVRALFVSAGNPLHSVPGDGMRAALEQLDLLVSIDLYVNETAQYADYVLPATDMLERSDFPISWSILQETPHAQYTSAMVSPKGERREEWEIFSDLAIACGASPLGTTVCNAMPRINHWLAKLPGDWRITPDHILALLMRWGGKTSLKALQRSPRGVMLPATEPGSFLGKRVPTDNGKIRLAPEVLLHDLPRLEHAAQHWLSAARDELMLIGRRERRSHNSWMHNNPHIRQPVSNTALMHPKDARARGISDGDKIQVCHGKNAVYVPVKLTEDIAPGVVAVPHGWGHEEAELSRARQLDGMNINQILPGGAANMEPVSGQTLMLGFRVKVAKAATIDLSTAV